MKTKLTLVFAFIFTVSFAQNNLLDYSTWTVGTGSAPGFARNGPEIENERELGLNPHGDQEILWKAIPSGDSSNDGGWNGSYFNIDHTKTYRFTVWIKKTNSSNGTTYSGLYTKNASNAHTTLNLDGTPRNNAYFWYGDLPLLDKWYLIIGYVHRSSHTGTTVTGGVYDGDTGTKVLSGIRDFKFSPNATKMMHRAYLFYDTDTSDRQFFWGPTVYEVNGQEPTIEELVNPGGTSSGGESVWNIDITNINYTAGKVGIGTANPDEMLTVKGKIHAEEVRVDLSVPAPDYVFKEEYDLKSLQDVQDYIKEYGHLPNIPSAQEMEMNGVELGTMEMKLLEKIEELTLYILEQEKKLKKQEQMNKQILNRLYKMETKSQR